MKAVIHLDDNIRKHCAALKAYAEQLENRKLSDDSWPTDPNFLLKLPKTRHTVIFRVVLCQTETGLLPMRWLAVTAGASTPHPYAVWTIADQLGFTGAETNPEGSVVGRGKWDVDLEYIEGNAWVVVQQLLQN